MEYEYSLLSILVCFWITNILANLKTFNYLDERKNRSETIDGLRGFLALSVFFHHFVVTYYWKTYKTWMAPPEIIYFNYGRVGIALFFMISGFLFIGKLLDQKENINWLKLYESRLFRIFPVYIFSILIITFFVFSGSGWELKSSYFEIIDEYLQWFLFHGNEINGYQETKTVIAYVDWTLKYEWLFYFSLPLISILITKGNRYITAAMIMICFALFYKPHSVFSLSTKFLILFAIGGLVAYIYRLKLFNTEIFKTKLTSLVTAVLLIIILVYPYPLSFFHVLLMSWFFFYLAQGNDLFGILRLKTSRLLGEISYSIYLLHGTVLYLLFTYSPIIDVTELSPDMYALLLPFVTIIVILFSMTTFLMIERPFISIGRHYLLTTYLNSIANKISGILQKFSVKKR
jgi:peptidoglycan/LPS O-acetylase OafA/YrhL